MVFSFMMSMIKCELTTADVALIRKDEHTPAFNGPFSGTTRVSLYQKGKTNLDFTEA